MGFHIDIGLMSFGIKNFMESLESFDSEFLGIVYMIDAIIGNHAHMSPIYLSYLFVILLGSTSKSLCEIMIHRFIYDIVYYFCHMI